MRCPWGHQYNAFGYGQHESNLWPSLIRSAQDGSDFCMTEGQQVRDFIPVVDVANHFVYAALDQQLREGSPFVANLGSGNPVTVREFAELWWNTFKAKGNLKIGSIPYRENEIMRFVPSLIPAYI